MAKNTRRGALGLPPEFYIYFLAASGIALLVFNIAIKNLLPTDTWSRAADALNFLLGIPAALAGSIVAIQLSRNALATSQQAVEIAERQEYQDIFKIIAETHSLSLNCYWSLAVAILDTIQVGERVSREFVSELTQHWASDPGSPPPTNLTLPSLKDMPSILAALRAAILELSKHQFTKKCWEKSIASINPPSTTKVLERANEALGYKFYRQTTSDRDIFNAAQRVGTLISVINLEATLHALYEYYGIQDEESFRDIRERIISSKNDKREILLLAGISIYCPRLGGVRLNFASALLVDLINAIPSSKDIAADLGDMAENLALTDNRFARLAIERAKGDLDPAALLPGDISEAARELASGANSFADDHFRQ